MEYRPWAFLRSLVWHMGEFRLLADINLHTQINRVCPQVEWCFFLLFFVVFRRRWDSRPGIGGGTHQRRPGRELLTPALPGRGGLGGVLQGRPAHVSLGASGLAGAPL